MSLKWKWNYEAKERLNEAKARIGASSFANQLVEEILRDKPTRIGIEAGRICWGSVTSFRPEKEIHFSDRGYYGLSTAEIEALMDLFVRKSDRRYYKTHDEDSFNWPYWTLYLSQNNAHSLRNW